MTNLEAIKEDLKPFPVEDSLIERKCIKHLLTASAVVTDESTITLIVIEILSQMVSLSSVGEGGVSKSFDKGEVEAQIDRLCLELGLDSSIYYKKATVTRLE